MLQGLDRQSVSISVNPHRFGSQNVLNPKPYTLNPKAIARMAVFAASFSKLSGSGSRVQRLHLHHVGVSENRGP